MHAAAAHRRPGPRCGTPLHRPRHDCRRRLGVGILQSRGDGRCAARAGASLCPVARRRTDVCARDDQKTPASGMGDGPRCGHRSGSAGAGAVHADAGLPPRVRRIRGEEDAQVRRQLRAIDMDRAHLDWPFFAAEHRELAAGLAAWCAALPKVTAAAIPGDVDVACRRLVRALGAGGWLRYGVPAVHGGALPALDSRALCVAREMLAYHDGLADFAFAMQGLGSGAITLAGSDAQRARWLPAVARGEAIAAFALSEPAAGSHVAGLSTRAVRDGADWVLDGCKTWISNGGIADFYCVFARTGTATGAKGVSAFIVPAGALGLHIAERITVIAPHPLARIEFHGCRLPA